MSLQHPRHYELTACHVCHAQNTQHVPLLEGTVKHRGRFHGDTLRVVACRQCGVVFINPQPTASEYAGFYKSEYYQLNWPSDPERIRQNVNLLNRETTHYLNCYFKTRSLTDLTGKANPSVLDVGAGYGAGIEFLLQRRLTTANRIAAIEPSREAASFLRQHYGIEVREELLETTTFDPTQFDFVISLALIEHLGDPLEGIQAFWRLLQSGGRLMLATPCLDTEILEQRGLDWFKIVHPFYFSRASLTRLLQAGGFSVLSEEVHHSLAGDYNMMIFVAEKQPTLPKPESLFHNPASLNLVRSEIDILKEHIRYFNTAFPERWIPFTPPQKKKRRDRRLVHWMHSLLKSLRRE
jgi:SAM-dependent methyltransferase